MSDNDFSNDSMLELYLFEANGLLDQLDDILLQSESDNSLTKENIHEIFRIMHTIKGSSSMMAFDLISSISHSVEDLFSIIRDNGIDKEKFEGLFDLVLKVSAFLKGEVKKIQDGSELAKENKDLKAKIEAMLDEFADDIPAKDPKESVGRTLGGPPPLLEEKPETTAPVPQTAGQKTYFLHVYFNEGSKMENIRAFMLVNKLKELGTVNEAIPSDLENDADSAEYIIENGLYVSFTTAITREEIETVSKGILSVESVSFMKKMPDEFTFDPDSQDKDVAQKDEPAIDPAVIDPAVDETVDVVVDEAVDAKEEPDVPAAKNSKPTKQSLINVDLKKLDNLMDLVGELVITESMVTENPELQDLKLDNFRKSARQLNKLTDELQDIVMSVRLVPISSVFQRMRRVVRDMSKDLNKDVELVLIGEHTEIDKTILDALGDPLMHLVRNAMDHAIEDREGREKAGKSSTGHIILSAQNMGGDIIISISDDGIGLDPQHILAKAKDKNLLIKPEHEYTDKETFSLLMTPGFSTKEQVTEYSGRGVGMDVVKMKIQAIGGSVIIESVKGIGTNIFLKIPVTLAIIPCMEIKVSGDTFCLPISNIKESFKVSDNEIISDPDGNEMVMLRGSAYPVIRLNEMYDLEKPETDPDNAILILVDSGDKMACLMVDELIGKSQVVVKPIPLYLSGFNVKKSGVSGCTIMGDGSISLILDVMEILS